MKMPEWVSLPRSTVDLAVLDRPAEPVDPTRGNTRLTAATGIVLVALLAVEAVTLLSVRQLLTLHVIVGALLIGPVLLKSASTAYRFTRYYSGAPTYRRKGPPPLPLRLLGPLIIVAALAVLGTGVALILVGPSGSGLLLTAHQTSFWFLRGVPGRAPARASVGRDRGVVARAAGLADRRGCAAAALALSEHRARPCGGGRGGHPAGPVGHAVDEPAGRPLGDRPHRAALSGGAAAAPLILRRF